MRWWCTRRRGIALVSGLPDARARKRTSLPRMAAHRHVDHRSAVGPRVAALVSFLKVDAAARYNPLGAIVRSERAPGGSMKRLSPQVLLTLLSWLPVFAATPALAQAAIYRWVDGAGEVHFSQGVDSVPPRYRAGAVVIGYDRPPEPSAPAPPKREPGIGQIRFTPGQPIMVNARINDSGSAQLMLDTGATRTLINPSVLNTLGVSYANAVRASLRSVTGEVEVEAVRLDSIDVGGAKYGPLLVISHDTGFGPTKGDGLL